jgi:hypothetical protein
MSSHLGSSTLLGMLDPKDEDNAILQNAISYS